MYSTIITLMICLYKYKKTDSCIWALGDPICGGGSEMKQDLYEDLYGRGAK